MVLIMYNKEDYIMGHDINGRDLEDVDFGDRFVQYILVKVFVSYFRDKSTTSPSSEASLTV